jgi:iron complex outermembrane recepter protein
MYSHAFAQRADENAVTAASDAFGSSVGTERVGLYDVADVRGFSPTEAGNARIESLYFDLVAAPTTRLIARSTVRIGLFAHGYPFVAPTGIVDYGLRPAGDRPILSSVLTIGPHATRAVELDAQLPLIDKRLNLAAGYALRTDELTEGGGGSLVGRAVAPRISLFNGAVEIRPFWGRVDQYDYLRMPLIFSDGSALPPPIEPRYFGQRWSSSDWSSEVSGAVLRGRLTPRWSIHGGVFRADASSEGYLELYLRTRADGSATHAVLSTPAQQTRSYSGELRLTRTWTEGPRSHQLHLSWRGRDVEARYGGSSLAVLETARIGTRVETTEPLLRHGSRSLDRVDQSFMGLSYSASWPRIGELTVATQHSSYQKQVTVPLAATTGNRDSTVLFSATLSAHFTPRLVLYAGRTVGLEESGNAPENASNYPYTAPASRTEQWDAGVSFKLNERLRLLVGAFEISKPYFNVDPTDRVFRNIGAVSHRGIELSFAGQVTRALNVTLGSMFMDPRVSGAAVDQRLIGTLPVGVARRRVRANADYRLPFWSATSLDIAASYLSGEVASAQYLPERNQQLLTDPRTLWDIGGRYRFKIGRFPAMLRLMVNNATDEFAWNVSSGGAFSAIEPRRLSAYLTVDLQ